MSSIKVPDIRTGDTFWHDGLRYTATGDAWRRSGDWYSVPVTDDASAHVPALILHADGAVLRAGAVR